MSLLDDLRADRRFPGGKCAVARLSETLPDDLRGDFIEAVADRTISAARISDAMRKRDFPIGQQSIGNHRRGSCSCQA